MKLLKFFSILFLLIIFLPNKSFAEMPEISAGKTHFDIFKGYYVLEDNVNVVMKNHGVTATITANSAKVNVMTQKCWANGKVTLTHDDINFSCDKAYLQWKTSTAEVVGNVNFKNKKNISVTSDTAVFSWKDKTIDFYGKVKLNAEKTVQFAEGLKLKNKIYAHVQYDVKENKILKLEEKTTDPEIVIPEPDE